jgi:hypothetical protein
MLDYYTNPANLVVQIDAGDGHMGSLDLPLADNYDARFGLDVPFVLVGVRAHFSGGSGLANLTINVDSGRGIAHDYLLDTVEGPLRTGVGTGKDINYRVLPEELVGWRFDGAIGDKMTCVWTNPDPGNMLWGLEVSLMPVAL